MDTTSCHLNIPGEFSLGAVSADGLGEVSLGVAPGVGRGHLNGHHPCGHNIIIRCSIMTTLKVNQNFGFLVENVDSLFWLAHESKWIFMPLFVDENALLIPFLCYFSFFLPGSFIVSVLK